MSDCYRIAECENLVALALEGVAEERAIDDKGDEWSYIHRELQELLDLMDERLEEQKEKHHGGTYWVGTGGTSTMGRGGYNTQGIRVGGKSRHKTALQIAGERNFKDFREDKVLDIRQFQMAFRKLRQFSARTEGEKTELDMEQTIRATSDNAGMLELETGITQLESGLEQLDSGIQMIEILVGVLDISMEAAQKTLELAQNSPVIDEEHVKELEQKLYTEASPDIAAAVVERLREVGLLDDERYAARLARSLSEVKHYPRRRIEQELRHRGISSMLIQTALSELEGEDYEQALALLQKKYYNKLKLLNFVF